MNMQKYFLLLIIISIIFTGALSAQETTKNNVNVYFFGTSTCPYCAQEKEFLKNYVVDNLNLTVNYYELNTTKDSSKLLLEFGNTFNQRTTSIPITFIGNKSWIGFNESIKQEIITEINNCSINLCKDSMEYLKDPKLWTKYTNDQSYVNIFQSQQIAPTIEPNSGKEILIDLFYVEDCQQCINTLEYIKYLQTKYPDVNIQTHNVNVLENKELFQIFKNNYSLQVETYPIAFIGKTYIAGETNIENNLNTEITRCYNTDLSCEFPLKNINPITNKLPDSSEYVSGDNNKTITLFGNEVGLEHKSLFLNTLIISFVDGLNPCSLWVLLFLLSIVVYSGSRKKIFIIGVTFLTVTAIIYGLFITSVLNALIFFYSPIIKLIIVLVSIIFGLINVKDYFWYKKGISLTISDKQKPKIFDRIRNLMNPKNTFFTLILGTIILAAGVTILEIPCTAGLPLLWANMIANSTISTGWYYALLGTYMFIYLLDEIVLFTIATFTLKISKMEDKHGKILKLFSGLLIFGIGLSFVVANKFMQGILGILSLTVACIILTWIINIIYTKYKKKKK